MIPIAYCENLPFDSGDAPYEKLLAEYAAAGAKHMVAGVTFMKRSLADPAFPSRISRSIATLGMSYRGAHSFWGPTWDLNVLDPEVFKTMIENQKSIIAITGEIGADVLVIHPGDSQFKTGDPDPLTLRKQTIRALEILLPYAEKCGVRISIENIIAPSDSAAENLAILEHFASPRLVFCYDTGHANVMEDAPGKDPLLVNPYIRTRLWHDRLVFDPESTLERLAPYVVTAHVHDNNGFTDEHKMPGNGTIDWTTEAPRLLACPNLEFIQNEADWRRDGVPVAGVVAEFTRLFN